MKNILTNKKFITAGIFGIAVVVLAGAVLIYWPAEKPAVEKPNTVSDVDSRLRGNDIERNDGIVRADSNTNGNATVQKNKIAEVSKTPKQPLPAVANPKRAYQLSKTSQIPMSQTQGQQMAANDTGSMQQRRNLQRQRFKPVFENKPVQAVTPEVANAIRQ
ncbi:MAG: hypothetical protein LLF92_09610 [Planctomycetaceae bacterium]|nr:hypothetical protein [Planctomycetaceae bacterium]